MPDDITTTNPLSPLPDPFYPDPTWATLTNNEWTLVEIKAGVELSKVHLHTRPCWLLGRAADQVHLPLAHPSISRCHARIAFDSTGTPWLRDLQSTHGVFVNKKRLPPEAVGVIEEVGKRRGSRGVQLYPGDVISVGASTRLYCLEGPEEFQRGRLRIPPVKKVAVAPTQEEETSSEDPAKEEKQEQEQDAGVSWGISMDEANIQQEEEESVEDAMKRQHSLENQAIPDKHRKAYEKIQALKYKLQNVQTESERIRKKGDLTAGQENQLQRNATREQQLGEQILEREKELYDKLNPDHKKRKKKHHHHHHEVDEDDDASFFDRTKENDSNDDSEGETEESLLRKWKDLQLQQKRNLPLLERAQTKLEALQQRLDRLQAAGDDEAFFAQNDLQLAQEQLSKVEHENEKIQEERNQTKRLLKIVNPSIVLDEPSSNMPPPPMLPPPMRKPHPASEGGMPPPPGNMLPPPTRKRPPPETTSIAAPDEPPEKQPAKEDTIAPPKQPSSSTSNKKPKVKGPARGPPGPPVMGTLAALTAVSSSSSKGDGSNKSHNQNSKSADQQKKPAAAIDLKKDEWRAPKDQDGSGITKLNAKFAGRY